ncbi:cupin domain-containing protein [Dactylosporangium fulvum]|uniref:Cupin domain-containing protein n=1 Tax=Dactylosporangium fulvum TaxID=53359 RepID=A0ABY5VPU5_9ACTN|nr:cupin domain-containing protein [Dactylosporangium fulvum]UWP79777.1 cupin domain-containing protein [Dactylosporangium fulvum]
MTTSAITPAVRHAQVQSVDLPEKSVAGSAPGGDVYEVSLPMWPDERKGIMKSGIWEATPGLLRGKREGWAEICHIISGRATVTTEGGDAVELGPGDVLVLPDGWRGTWEIHETVRKFYALQRFDTYRP